MMKLFVFTCFNGVHVEKEPSVGYLESYAGQIPDIKVRTA